MSTLHKSTHTDTASSSWIVVPKRLQVMSSHKCLNTDLCHCINVCKREFVQCHNESLSAGAGGPVVEGGSFHLAAPGSIPGISTRLGVQGCDGAHSTLTAGIIRAKGPLVVTCILRFVTLGQAPNSRNVQCFSK